ncbi:MAG: hypothetical protein KA712_01370 [Myxococcales bacterium]|nr:hypothetical protein [Myxococcales bacterium]
MKSVLIVVSLIVNGGGDSDIHTPREVAKPPAALAGRWEVEQVAVDAEDRLHQLYGPDDPRLVGRTFIIDGERTSLEFGHDLYCKQRAWPVRRTTWGFLISRGFWRPPMGGRPARPSTDDFNMGVTKAQGVAAYRICPTATGNRGRSFARGYWAALYKHDRLALRADPQFILLLKRVPEDTPPQAGTFDCGKPGNETETTICAHLDLAAWDRSVALALQQYLEASPEKAEKVKSAQADYVRTRNACGQDVECIRDAQDARVDELVQLKALP